MDGLTFLRKIMKERPTPVIICSTVAGPGSRAAAEALSLGAVEVIHKPSHEVKGFISDSSYEIQRTIRAAAIAKLSAGSKFATPSEPTTKAVSHINKSTVVDKSTVGDKQSPDVMLKSKPHANQRSANNMVIAIGSSTGGVQILEYLFRNIKAPTPPIVVVQHMPAGFTKAMAERLNSLSELHVKEAEDGDALLPSRVLIAPGDYHMMVKNVGGVLKVEVKDGAKVSRHRPSVDVLFRSCANEVGAKALGFMLTGMGDDGSIGMSR
jgi:two-component system chemotaxis response regulator CheB